MIIHLLWMLFRNEGFSSIVSILAFSVMDLILLSFAQDGINPHCRCCISSGAACVMTGV